MISNSQNMTYRKRLYTESLLVVDDDANSRLLLKTYLSAEGYNVVSVTNGEDAISYCKENTPDLVLLDVRLPGIDGFEVCRRLKSIKNSAFIPIVMATALRGNEQRVKGIDAGADDFITKPYNRVEMNTRVRSLLRISKLHKKLSAKVVELEATKEKLRKLAVTDGLTGLYNYRAFKHQLTLEVSRSIRFGMSLSLLMIDIDFFKKYNDMWGHPVGDTLLSQYAKLLQKNLRDVDFPARYGGEEFAIILPGANVESAVIVAEKLRALTEQAPFYGKQKMPGRAITISLGIATFPDNTKDADKLIDLADHALYYAKKHGRNQWQTAL
ncbi:diguanylate cyclase [bacterium]|nr:diguanylate cyclase [bacterium]